MSATSRADEWVEKALERLSDVLADVAPDASTVLVIQDDTPMRRRGADLKQAVAEMLSAAGREVEVCELAGGVDGSLHADVERLDEVIDHLHPGVAVIALGSGTVTDLAKHACFTYEERTGEHLPLVFCPTALSVLAFFPGGLLIVPPFIAIYGLGTRIARMEAAAGTPNRAEPVVGLILGFVFSLYSLYYQSHLNDLWDRYLSPGTLPPPPPPMLPMPPPMVR